MDEALADHDRILVNLLNRARSINPKFSKNKLRLKLDQVTDIGQLFTSEGLKPDPMKVEAIASIPRPDHKRAVQRLLGCVNYLSRFMPQLSKVSEPLRKECHVHLGQLTGGNFPSIQKHDQLCAPVEVS